VNGFIGDMIIYELVVFSEYKILCVKIKKLCSFLIYALICIYPSIQFSKAHKIFQHFLNILRTEKYKKQDEKVKDVWD
jgi:hypothetical protein